jgi:hypothetical protein
VGDFNIIANQLTSPIKLTNNTYKSISTTTYRNDGVAGRKDEYSITQALINWNKGETNYGLYFRIFNTIYDSSIIYQSPSEANPPLLSITYMTPPNAPTNFIGTVNTENNTINYSWNDNSINETNFVIYEIKSSNWLTPNPATDTILATLPPNTTTWSEPYSSSVQDYARYVYLN